VQKTALPHPPDDMNAPGLARMFQEMLGPVIPDLPLLAAIRANTHSSGLA